MRTLDVHQPDAVARASPSPSGPSFRQEFPHDRVDRPAVPRVPRAVPRRGAVRLRQVLRSARGRLRLRRRPAHDDARGHRGAAAQPVALPRAAADQRRAAHRLHLRLHAAGPRRSAGRAARRPASSTSRTTASTTRRCPTRTASCRSPPRAPSSSASPCSAAPRPATSPTASRRTPRASGCTCYVFIPDDLEPGKVLGSAIYRPDADRRSAATTTTSTGSARRSPTSTAGASPTSTCAPTTPRAPRRSASRSPSSSAGGCRSTSSRRSPAARCCRASRAASASCATVGLVDGRLPKIYAAQAAGCAPVVKALHAGIDSSRSGAAGHHRQVDRHRQPGRRLPGDRGAEGDRRLGRDGHRRRDPSTASTCWPRPRASSPSPPAARRWRSRRS